MKTIAIATQKGGAGKTTLAINLACAAAQDGLITLIIDADSQKTAQEWFNKRDNQDNPIVLSANNHDELQRILTMAGENGIERVFIDTQGAEANLVTLALRKADFVLIPCGAGGLDISAQRTTAQSVLTLDKSAAFIITKSTKSSNDARDTRLVLQGMGIPVCDQMTTWLKAYKDSAAFYNQSVLEYEPKGKAAAEMRALFNWLEGKLIKNKLLETMQGVSHAA